MNSEHKTRKSADEKTFNQETFDRLIEEIEKGLEEGIIEIPTDLMNDWDKGAREGVPSNGLFRVVQPGEAGDRTSQASQERIEELASYYDHADTAELEGEDVTDQVQIGKSDDMEQISIRLPREDLDQIRRRAKTAGVGYTTMIRMIVHAHLENPLTY